MAIIWFLAFVSIICLKKKDKVLNCNILVQVFLCYSDPESHPFITDKEKTYLQKELGQLERDKNMPPTPWKAILTSVPMIALVFAQVIISIL